MSTQDDKNDAQGRSLDQVTKNGTSSAGSMGVGGTGNSGKLQGDGSQQAAGRTDDLLHDGSEMVDKGFSSEDGQVQTGLEGIGNLTGGGKGNRQSGQSGQQGGQSQQGGQGSRDASRDDDTESEFRQNR